MFRFGTAELILIFLIILLLFGAKKLPEVAKAIGRAIREFKKAGKEMGDQDKEENEHKTP